MRADLLCVGGGSRIVRWAHPEDCKVFLDYLPLECTRLIVDFLIGEYYQTSNDRVRICIDEWKKEIEFAEWEAVSACDFPVTVDRLVHVSWPPIRDARGRLRTDHTYIASSEYNGIDAKYLWASAIYHRLIESPQAINWLNAGMVDNMRPAIATVNVSELRPWTASKDAWLTWINELRDGIDISNVFINRRMTSLIIKACLYYLLIKGKIRYATAQEVENEVLLVSAIQDYLGRVEVTTETPKFVPDAVVTTILDDYNPERVQVSTTWCKGDTCYINNPDEIQEALRKHHEEYRATTVGEWSRERIEFYEQMYSASMDKVNCVGCDIASGFRKCLSEAVSGFAQLYSYINSWRWPLWALVLMDIMSILLLMWLLYVLGKKAWRWYNVELREVKKQQSVTVPPRMLGLREIAGRTFAKILVAGKDYLVDMSSLGLPGSDANQLEMAIPGSDLFPSIHRSVGAVCVLDEFKDKVSIVGCFWRHGNYLITAKHVANTVNCGVAPIYLVPPETAKSGGKTVLRKKVVKLEDDWFSDENNACKCELDIFCRKMTVDQWSSLSMSQLSVKKNSCYNQQVTAVGYVNDMLMTSNGKTLKGSGIELLFHTATTQKGFSGAPVFSGSSVVGMHLSAGDGTNVAVRIEQILSYMPKNMLESAGGSDIPDFKKQTHAFKFRGRDVEIEEDERGVNMLTNGGHVLLGVDRESYEAEFPTRKLTRREEFDQEELIFGTVRAPINKNPRQMVYDDEAANVTIELPGERPVHCNSTPKEQVEVVEYLADKSEELKSLGFEEGACDYPEITLESECGSVLKHLEMYCERLNNLTHPPTSGEMDRVAVLLANKMGAIKYQPRPGYKKMETLVEILDSSLVKTSKSPGHPYQESGMMTNGAVLTQFGKVGFAQHVLNEWNSVKERPIQLKCFTKTEANKVKKLRNGMERIVSGFPLDKMVKHQAIFRDKLDAAVDGWSLTPKAYAFNPLLPGRTLHLAKKFDRRRVYESDKSNWDYMCFKYVYEISKRLNAHLAVQHPDMSNEEWADWMKDAADAYDEICDGCVYRCSNGRVFKNPAGAMKSGCLITIDTNTDGQLIVDTLVKMRLGWSDEKISEWLDYTVAGGDDMLQSFPEDMDLQAYVAEAAKLGVEMEFEIRKSFDGASFYSNDFSYDKSDGAWKFKPVRFTKHIQKLRRTKLEDLPGAIASHMQNYVWDNKRFAFFEKMFRKMRVKYPDQFKLSYLKSQRQLQYKVLGYEAFEPSET